MPWPPLDYEDQLWVPAAMPTSHRSGRGEPYRSAVPPVIANLVPDVDPDIARAAHDAAQELTRLDAELGVRVQNFAPILLRSEAASSSQIEHITASARAVLSAELGARSGRNAQEIVANTRAMTAAIDLADDISVTSIARMHEVLMAAQPRHTPGRFRDEAVWVGTRADTPVGADFVAPHHSRVADLMDDLVQFSRRVDLPSVISIAIAHAQFETIHPFTDGNGRTGRAFAQSLLRHRGVTRSVAVPVSAGLLADVQGYHAALTAYRLGDPSPIVSALANAAVRAVHNTRSLVAELDGIRDTWSDRLSARRSSNAWRLLDVIIRMPVLTSAAAAQQLGIKQPNVYPPLAALVDASILKSKSEHNLGPFWRSDEVLAAIDRFAERAGRREAS